MNLISYKALLPTWMSSEDPDLWNKEMLTERSHHEQSGRTEPRHEERRTASRLGAYYKLNLSRLVYRALSIKSVTVL